MVENVFIWTCDYCPKKEIKRGHGFPGGDWKYHPGYNGKPHKHTCSLVCYAKRLQMIKDGVDNG